MSAAGKVEVRGLKEFRADLAKLSNSSRWNKDLAKSQRQLGTKVAGWARSSAAGMGGPYSHFSGAIRGAGGVTGAKVGIAPQANATFWGAKKHTGWYGASQYQGGPAQHPEWVGAGWEVAGPGGPYAINSTIGNRMDWILDEYGNAIDRITADAFDYGSRVSTF